MNIIVTGASRGIGYQLARRFALGHSMKIVAIARDKDALEKLKSENNNCNGKVQVFPLAFDLAHGDYSGLTARIREVLPYVDILVNNAGCLSRGSFEETSGEAARQMFEVNVFATARLIQALLPMLGQDKRSHVVNIGSMAGVQGAKKFPGLSYYSASKAAVTALTESLAEEFKDRGIAFNCLALGSVQTEMLDKAFPGMKAPVDAYEMASFIADFAVKAHHYMNGKTVQVNLSTP
jgi:short-subunit dehydrogenase